jgi:hypothetical protein
MPETAPAVHVSVQELLQATWDQQARCSAEADKFKSQIDRWRGVAAIAGVVGVVLETLAASLSALGDAAILVRTILALIGAVVLVAVPIAVSRTSTEHVRDWTRARSAAEGLKEKIWRFLAGGPPYGVGRDPGQLVKDRTRIVADVNDLTARAGAITLSERNRPLQPVTADEYIKQRVDQQIDEYYTAKGTAYAGKAERWRFYAFWLGVLAAAAAALAGASTGGFAQLAWLPGLGPWAAALTTTGAAITAHVAAARYDELTVNYLATANRLTELRDQFTFDPQRQTPDRIAKFVDDVESAISTENESWRAVLSERKAKSPTGA